MLPPVVAESGCCKESRIPGRSGLSAHIRFIRMNRMAPSRGAGRPDQAADSLPRGATSQPAYTGLTSGRGGRGPARGIDAGSSSDQWATRLGRLLALHPARTRAQPSPHRCRDRSEARHCLRQRPSQPVTPRGVEATRKGVRRGARKDARSGGGRHCTCPRHGPRVAFASRRQQAVGRSSAPQRCKGRASDAPRVPRWGRSDLRRHSSPSHGDGAPFRGARQ